MRLFALGLAAASFLLADSPQAPGVGIGGLNLGFVYNPGIGVQPILGITGSSTFGAPVNIGIQVDAAWISPQQDYVVVRSGKSFSVAPLTGSLDSVAAKSIDGLASGGDLFAFSATGAAFAVWDKAANHVTTVSGLPDNPSIARDVDLTPAGNGTINALAISDDAGALAGGFVAADNTASVWLLNPGGDTRSLMGVQHTGALGFALRARDLYIGDDAANNIVRIRDVTGAGDMAQIAANPDGVAGPLAIAFSKDNTRAFVVNGASQSIMVLDLTGTKSPVMFTCPCVPGALYRMAGDSVFRLTEPGPAPLWLFDADNVTPRFVFVPPYKIPQPPQ